MLKTALRVSELDLGHIMGRVDNGRNRKKNEKFRKRKERALSVRVDSDVSGDDYVFQSGETTLGLGCGIIDIYAMLEVVRV